MGTPTTVRSVSVIINTDGRAKALATCLESLRYLRYPNFEVVVVAGPTRDGTHELLDGLGKEIKHGSVPVRNLSHSRNVAIEMSSGEIVAFLDDDSIPEPEWLDDVVPSFEDSEVGVAGGFLHDHTGKTYQWQFGTADRFGGADTTWQRATPEFNFPFSFNFPHVMANSAFRRAAIVDVGGFDEEYEYYLDETDIICRLVDAGWQVRQLSRGFVHHKYMPSEIRGEARVLKSWYSVIKNRTYFSLMNACGHASTMRILEEVQALVAHFRANVRWAIKEGHLTESDAERFEEEADRGLRKGLSAGLDGRRRLRPVEGLRGQRPHLLQFKPLLPANKQMCFCLLTQAFPPEQSGGIGTWVKTLARAIARLGHQVHVLTRGHGHDRVDFVDGVWIHRIIPKAQEMSFNKFASALQVPRHVWDYSATMLEEVREIHARRRVDCVCAPIWDGEGIAFLFDRSIPLVTTLQTTLTSYLECNPDRQADATFMKGFAEPMLRVERFLLTESDGVLAISAAIVSTVEQDYGIALDRRRLAVIPIGLEDSRFLASRPAPRLASAAVRIVFAGRLEARKGIDVFLEAAKRLLSRFRNLHIDVVGNDTIEGPRGRTYRDLFETDNAETPFRERVVFHGEVSEDALLGFYRAADIIVAPSRFESFGLVLLEAMMEGKPVVGCRVGGMTEIVEHGVSGLLAEPGDVASLEACLEQLVSDESLRNRLGEGARRRYAERFTPVRMAERVIEFLSRPTRVRSREVATISLPIS
jgi:glycosyltransferase involved in cell wall biosynthesis/GT2 family glycosyltransferase